MGNSVAFKCTYNDGDEGVFVGFAQTCSDANLIRNVRNKVWCGDRECQCRKYYDNEWKGTRPTFPCMESRLFIDWEFGVGAFHHGVKRGHAKHFDINGTEVGKLAILTTRFPNESENQRRIIGIFEIGEIVNQNLVRAANKGRVRLPLEEARQLYFWSYYSRGDSNGNPKWGSNLHRYIEDGQVHRILVDLLATVRDEKTKEDLYYLLNRHFGNAPAPLAGGLMPELSVDRISSIAEFRKYGLGGEGEKHKELKLWVANNPHVLNLNDVVETRVERPFFSGDVVDILFTHESGNYTVVEIETNVPFPGAHQAIKYKALMCAELRLPLNSEKVSAFLVAWTIPEEVKNFCGKYQIKLSEQRVPAEL